MSDIRIAWLTDWHDCETCGLSYAEGARVSIDGSVVLEFTPVAHCRGGDNRTDSEVYAALFAYLGHTVTEDFGPAD